MLKQIFTVILEEDDNLMSRCEDNKISNNKVEKKNKKKWCDAILTLFDNPEFENEFEQNVETQDTLENKYKKKLYTNLERIESDKKVSDTVSCFG
ncbi:hypothetical protein NPIL_684651 [Nephila pilipes]|uniref:Uncharacterized protein n=1 Tax=Nephila pilipes TaxID=299642 RepID=A0A8X6T2Q6_NEPPI|nr:hypothetical protein NPIL_684651 [Nephila pilipes]